MMTRTARSRLSVLVAAVALVGALSGVLLSPVAAQQPPPAEPDKPTGLSAVRRRMTGWCSPGATPATTPSPAM